MILEVGYTYRKLNIILEVGYDIGSWTYTLEVGYTYQKLNIILQVGDTCKLEVGYAYQKSNIISEARYTYWMSDIHIRIVKNWWISCKVFWLKQCLIVTWCVIINNNLLYKAEKLSVCLSTCIFGMLITQQSLHQNGTYSKWKRCLWRSQSLFLQAHRTHCPSTGVYKRWRFKQPLTYKTSGQWFKSHSTHLLL